MADDAAEFRNWIDSVLEFGFDSFSDDSCEVFVLIEDRSGERHAINVEYLGDDPEGFRNSGRELIGSFHDAQYYGMTWCGSFAGNKWHQQTVLFAEVGARDGAALVVVHPYQGSKSGRLTKAGKQSVVSEAKNLWDRDPSNDKVQSTAKATGSKSNRQKSPKTEAESIPCVTLDDLAERSIQLALERMQQGNETPFLCLIESEGLENRMISCDPEEDDDFTEIVDNLRGVVVHADQAELYAVVFFATVEEDGKEVDIVIAETGDRNGAAPVYGLTFKVSKALKLKTGPQIDVIDQLQNLWFSDEK